MLLIRNVDTHASARVSADIISYLAHVQTIFVARDSIAAAERKTRLPLASPIARHRRTLFWPSVLDDKLAAVGVLAESSTLCARAADEDMSTPARQASW